MSYNNKVVVYCVADEGIELSEVQDRLLEVLPKWGMGLSLFGTMSDHNVQSVAFAPAYLYPQLSTEGLHKIPRSETAVKEPAPYVVSLHELTFAAHRKNYGMVMCLFIGPNASAAFIEDDYLDVVESAMMNINDDVSPVEDLASDSDGIEGLVYDIMQHAAFYPENEFEDSDYEKFEEEQTVLVAFYQ